jgi:hypothetical protein
LIAIVPVSNEPPPGSDNALSQSVGRGRATVVATSTNPKLGLPQHRYCKVESDQENKLDGPAGIYSYFLFTEMHIFLFLK